jgi:hypothetical protein
MSAQSIAAVEEEPRPRRPSHRLFVGMGLLSLVVVFFGFARTYFLKAHYGTPPLTMLFHAHGAVFTAWVLLFTSQAALIARHHTRLHQKLGVAAGILAIAVIGLGTAVVIVTGRRDLAAGDAAVFFQLAGGLAGMIIFAFLVGFALRQRRVPETHKRLMLLATLTFLGPALFRLPFVVGRPGIGFMLYLAPLFLVILYDRVSRGHIHRSYLYGGILVLAVMPPVWIPLSLSPAWRRFATWLLS